MREQLLEGENLELLDTDIRIEDPRMNDKELLAWLAEHGTEISRAELEASWPRVLAAIERREAEAGDKAAPDPDPSGPSPQK